MCVAGVENEGDATLFQQFAKPSSIAITQTEIHNGSG
jgi:hypothetical protein